jgi:P27 family predicted phage terminase small subunit
MMAKPGRPKGKRIPKRAAKTGIELPPKPENLTTSQERHWREVTTNPHLTTSDYSLIDDYMRTLVIRDHAGSLVFKEGLLVEGYRNEKKTNPAYRTFRDCSQHLLRLRHLMKLTPESRDLEPPKQAQEIREEAFAEMRDLID